MLLLLTTIAPGIVYYGEGEEPVIALTVDDGFNTIFTSQILEILDY